MVLFTMLYKKALYCVCKTIQMKATEQYFLVVQFTMLYEVALNLEFKIVNGLTQELSRDRSFLAIDV